MHPRIYVIGFNNQERLGRCLESIPPKYERVLLDNGSTDLTAPHGVEYHKTGPDWFTPAFNYALRDAMEHNAIPIICNDDIVCEHECIERMLEEIGQCGIVSPMHVDNAGTVTMGGTAEAYPAGMHLTGARSMFKEKRDFPWLPFTCVAINPELVRTIGLLDSNCVMIFSDSDYCIRANRAGYAVRLLPDAAILHEHMASIQAERNAQNKRLDLVMLADRIYFENKWGGNQLQVVS